MTLDFLGRVRELARNGLGSCAPNPRVGAVAVVDGRVVGEGWHRGYGRPHAEEEALLAAAASGHPQPHEVWVSLEPCSTVGKRPACTDLLVAAGVGRIVCGAVDPNPEHRGAGLERLADAGIDVMQADGSGAFAEDNAAFVRSLSLGRPWVILKWACDEGGHVGGSSRRWVTGEEARARVHDLRGSCEAVMAGSGTLRADDPRLDARGECILDGPPMRVVLDSSWSTVSDAAWLRDGSGDRLVVGCETASVEARRALEEAGASVEVAGAGPNVDLAAALSLLGDRGVRRVLVEAGPRLGRALLEAGLADQVEAHVSADPLVEGLVEGPLGAGTADPVSALGLVDPYGWEAGADEIRGGFLP